MSIKPYRIDFKVTVEEQASMMIAAETPEAAEEGAKVFLQGQGGIYDTAEITKVEEATQPPEETPHIH